MIEHCVVEPCLCNCNNVKVTSIRGGSRILREWFAPTKLGGFEGMLPQGNLKFSALRMPFSCILRAAQAIQTHKNMLEPFKLIEHPVSVET